MFGVSERLEQAAKRVLTVLNENGYDAFFVGGCVRDHVLGRNVQDIDIATSARPNIVQSLFARTVPTGLQHGTVTVIEDGIAFEVTTFRKEGRYESSRRPENVEFIDDLTEDLKRRDFTINAMAIDRHGVLYDPFDGRQDMDSKILRCVGIPSERFSEDALRMMRCVRFAAEYGLEVDKLTWNALFTCGTSLQDIAMERIRMEWERIVGGSDPLRGLTLLVQSGLLHYLKSNTGISPERWAEALKRGHFVNVIQLEHAYLRWAYLFITLPASAQESKTALRRLTFSRRMIDQIGQIVGFHEFALQNIIANQDELPKRWKLACLRFGHKVLIDWLALFPYIRIDHDSADVVRTLLDFGPSWLRDMPAKTIEELAVTGADLVASGFEPGPEIGQVLNDLLERTALGKISNERSVLMREAENFLTTSDLLPDRLYESLRTKRMGHRIHYFSETESTQIVARELASQGASEGTLVIAEKQTAGRGTKGRSWHSPAGMGIWMSLVLRPSIPLVSAPQLTLLTAVALCRALKQETGIEIGIKWPNDLLVRGKKISGILLESRIEKNQLQWIVAGVGISVNMTETDFPAPLRDVATSLRIVAGRRLDRISLMCAVLCELEYLYEIYLEQGFMPIKHLWETYNVTLGNSIRVRTPIGDIVGVAESLDESGALMVRKDGGELVKVISGDVES